MLIFLPSKRDGGTENTMKKKVIMIFLVAVLAMAAFSCARSEDDHGSENSQSESAYSDAENSTDAGSRTDGGSDFSSDKSDGGKTEDNRDSKEDGKTEEEITPDGEEPDPDDGDGVDGTTRNELKNTDSTKTPSTKGNQSTGTTTVRRPSVTTKRPSSTTTKRPGSTTTGKTAQPNTFGQSTTTTTTPAPAPGEPINNSPAKSYPIKGSARTDPNADYNRPKVGSGALRAGSGPLGKQNIYIGDNDFMFIGESIPDYIGSDMLTDFYLKRLAKSMNDRYAWAQQNGKKLYFVVCPNKASVYGDYLSDYVNPADYTALDQAIDYMNANSSVKIIDLRNVLKSARSVYGDDLYYNYDTHWNANGGFVAYTEIMKHVKADFPNAVVYGKNDFNINYYETYMKDMPYYLGYYDKYRDEGPVYSLKFGPAAVLTSKRATNPTGQYVFCNVWDDGYRDDLRFAKFTSAKNMSAPSLYMMRDSYAIALVPFFKESFSTSTFSWQTNFSRTEITESGADVIIIEVVERSLLDLIKGRAFSD